MEMVEDGSMNPRLSLALSVSDRVIITVKKIITLRRSPVHTYFQEKWRGQLLNHKNRRLLRAPSTMNAAAYTTLVEHG